MSEYLIHINGQVQGVGFRPTVFRLAKEQGWTGRVFNVDTSLCIHLEASRDEAEAAARLVMQHAPERARVKGYDIKAVDRHGLEGFTIGRSGKNGYRDLEVTPDIALCDDCRKELFDPQNRRHRYPFTHCAVCGPRYSLVLDLPWDRGHTSMLPFDMCPECLKEYRDPGNRRFHAQINSCPECRVSLSLTDGKGRQFSEDSEESISLAVQALSEGKIVAVKGTGGYLLMCDAQNTEAVESLRKRKHRPHKPFAVMFPDLESIREEVLCTDEAIQWLTGPESPVTLLPKKGSTALAPNIATGLNELGVLYPYTPLFALVSSDFGGPLVATSANTSGSKIISENHEAIKRLAGVADLILHHNRHIVVPQDDSVIRMRPGGGKVILRRARGMAPSFCPPLPKSNGSLLAFGADMKAAVGMASGKQVLISQYIGDLENFDNQQGFESALSHLLSISGTHPDTVLCDLHPTYHSGQMAEAFSRKHGLSIVEVPHHEAHATAILGEHDLLYGKEPVLVLTWDGLGYGRNGEYLGSECFLFGKGQLRTVNRLPEFPAIANNRMALDPMLALFCVAGKEIDIRRKCSEHFGETTLDNYDKLAEDAGLCSSMGRLFDAAAAVLGINLSNSFEGQSAMWLEALAARHIPGNETPFDVFGRKDTPDPALLLTMMLSAADQPEKAAYRFHLTLAEWVSRMVKRHKVNKVAVSGGTFQNTLLLDLIEQSLPPGVSLLTHQTLSPNDECIPYGQIAWYILKKGNIHGDEPIHRSKNN